MDLLEQKLKEYFGFDRFKGNQKKIIQNVLDGQRDTFVLMPTGGGKSLCYQLPALMMRGTAIVISPLIALMKNQVDAIRYISTDSGIAHFLNSSLRKDQIEEVKADLRSGRTKLLYVAPESLTKHDNIQLLQSIEISFYAIDEAHCISEWGHDFRPEYRRIKSIVTEIGQKPIIALTATATPKVQSDIQKSLGMVDAVVFKSSFNRPNLQYSIKDKGQSVDTDLVKLVLSFGGQSGIIYCMSRNKVMAIAELLQANGIKALPYHAGLDSKERMDNQDAFLTEKADVIVATIAFGMGIDKPDVRFVIHYDFPKSLEGYYQETGRAGRDGKDARCIAFYSKQDLQKLEKFLKGKPVAEQEISRQLLNETSAYAESNICRRKVLLHYFGESYDKDNCGCCDNCLLQKKQVEAKEQLAQALEVITTLKEHFKPDHLICVLRGTTTAEIESLGHDKFEIFGIGQDVDTELWKEIFRQAELDGYISKDIENYGIIKVTAKGKSFLKLPKNFKVSVQDDEAVDEAPAEVASGGSGATDPVLFSMMKDLRKKMASQLGVPPYVVFQTTSLEAMATFYPITEEELKNIPGVGVGKAQKYGPEFLKLIKRHVEDNEIDRPEDMRVKTIANKSKLKITIVQQIDRKVDLEDIAVSNGLEFSELLDKIEAIVYSGTKINIDYFVREILDDDRIDEVYDYFRESTTDNLEKAMEELANDFSEEEVRLVRIKFLSELAN